MSLIKMVATDPDGQAELNGNNPEKLDVFAGCNLQLVTCNLKPATIDSTIEKLYKFLKRITFQFNTSFSIAFDDKKS